MKRLLLSLLLTVVLALPAFAQTMDMPMMGAGGGGGYGPMTGMGGMREDMMGMCLANADKIGLTDEQIKKIKPMHREMQKKRAQFQADLKIAEVDMMEIMDVKDFDLEKANAQVKKIAEMRTTHQLEMLKTMKEVRSVLTEEQFRKMQKLMHAKMAEKKPGKKRMMKKQ
jgi:Spy/CpxP family protein refolding chaperone